MRTLILPSPLLGPATYRPLAAALAGRGNPSRVADVRGRTVEAVAAGFADQARDADLLVPHSNAGRFVASAAGPARTVYMDATLPGDPMPAEVVAMLQQLADEHDVLPGWTDWWPTSEVDALLEPEWRAVVEAEQDRWPLAFLLDDPPVPPDWPSRPAGYLAFGTTYDAEATRAASYGWPVARMPGHHLEYLHDPDGVAARILALARTEGAAL